VDSQSSLKKMDEVYNVIGALKKTDCVLESVYKPADLYEISKGQSMGLKCIDKKKICLLSSIGNPGYFKQKIQQLGARIELEFTFLDHYDYKREDLYKIEGECNFFGAELIVVTKKDAVKIKRLSLANELAVPILVFDIEFEVIKNRKILDERLSGIYSS